MDNQQAEIQQAMSAWREDAEGVFAGKCLSAETRADAHAAHARLDKKKLQRLAEDHPELFMGLMDALSPLAQDVLIQYFLLRRTQQQIGAVIGLTTQHAVHYTIGDAIAELKGKVPTKKYFVQERVTIRREKWLGAEEIPIEENVLEMCFQPTNTNV